VQNLAGIVHFVILKSMKVSMQLEQMLRSIFGYRRISKINCDGRKFGISCSLVDRMIYIVRKPRKKLGKS
jgi:hypothetical protein